MFFECRKRYDSTRALSCLGTLQLRDVEQINENKLKKRLSFSIDIKVFESNKKPKESKPSKPSHKRKKPNE